MSTTPNPVMPLILDFAPGVPAKHYSDRLAEIRAVPESAVIAMNLDVLASTATVLGVIPELRALRGDLGAKLVEFDAAKVDHLESIALATYYTHTARLAERRRSEPLPALSERGVALRTELYVAANALAQRAILDPSSLSAYRGGVGYLQLSSDLGVLVKVFRDAWDAVQGKTAITKAEVDEAEVVGAQLVVGFGLREQAPGEPVVSTLDWQRAFSLLVSEYDEMRRAVSYLRWKERDADAIVPSLYAGRKNGNHRAATGDAADDAAPPATATSDVPHAPSLPSASALGSPFIGE